MANEAENNPHHERRPGAITFTGTPESRRFSMEESEATRMIAGLAGGNGRQTIAAK